MISIDVYSQDSISDKHSDYVLSVIRQHSMRKPPSDSFRTMLAMDTTILQIDHFVMSGMLRKECSLVKSSYRHLYGESLMTIANSLRFKIRDLNVSITLRIITQPGELDQIYYENGVYWIKYKPLEEEVEIVEEIELPTEPEVDSNYVLAALQNYVALKLPTHAFKMTKETDTTVLQVDYYLKSGMLRRECLIIESDHQQLMGEKLMGLANNLRFRGDFIDLSFELKIITYPGEENKVYFENGIYRIEYIVPT